MTRGWIGALGASLALAAHAIPALAEDAIELRNEVFQEVEVTDDAGRTRVERVPAARVVPGTEVIYVLTYRNVGNQPAADVVITNPVAPELAYRPDPGPAAGAAPEVSVDGGQRFGALAQLSVREPDGQARAAQGSDVTHLRWRFAEPVGAGEQGSVSYRAVLE